MLIIAKLQEMLSVYLVIAILAIGCYMSFLQSKSLHTVSHLDRESAFTRIVGYIYIAIGIGCAIILLI